MNSGKIVTVFAFVACTVLLATASPARAQEAGTSAANPTFAVVVGQSRILQVKDLVRVAVADPAIADVVVVSKTEVIVNGKSEGRTTLHVWDSSGRTSLDVSVYVDNAELLRQIENTIGMSAVRPRLARSTLVLDGTVETDAESKQAELIAKIYADKVLNLITAKRPPSPPSPPLVEASEVHAAIGVDGIAVRVIKDTVILEGTATSLLELERAEKIARIFSSQVLSFIVVGPVGVAQARKAPSGQGGEAAATVDVIGPVVEVIKGSQKTYVTMAETQGATRQ